MSIRETKLPVIQLQPMCPKVRFYWRVNNSRVGLIIANDGEPAYDISIPDIQLDQFRIKITLPFTRLCKEDGSKFCDVFIQNPGGILFPGESLFDVMRSHNAGSIPFQVRFSNSDGEWYVATCKLADRNANGRCRCQFANCGSICAAGN